MKPRMLLALACTLLPFAEKADARPIEAADLALEARLSDATMSPDGKSIAVIVTRADFVDNRYTRILVLVDAVSGTSRELAPGRTGVGSPQWSPGGERLAWLDAPGGGEPQIFVTRVGDPGSSPESVTSAAQGVESFKWSPDGASFAFVTPDTPPVRAGEERYNKSFEVGDNDYLATSAAVSSHVWLVGAQGGAARRLTSGIESVRQIEWMRGSDAIVFLSQPRPHDGELINASVKSVGIGSGEQRVLVQGSAGNNAVQGLFEPSPDGAWLAYSRTRGSEPSFRPEGIVVVPPSGGASREITAGIDRSLGGMVWMPDGKSTLVAGRDRSRFAVWIQPLEGAASRVDMGAVTDFRGVSVSRGGALALVGSEARKPAELYVMSSIHSRPRRLTRFNEHLAALDTGRIETMTWKLDGFEQNGVLLHPPGFTPERKWPLVLNIHGGPMASSTEAFDAFNQLLAAQGWLVFCPNYRGSSTTGDAFQSAIINDAGDGPGRDVMAGIEAVQARGIVDAQRIAVSGWSYGGYLTAWLTGHYQIWRAAVAGAAVTDWFDWYNLADLNVWAGYGLGGSPWLNGNALNYWRQSPMAYAHRIRTPTLILSTTGDRRVTVTQSYKLYHALKDNGVPVQFVVYPVGGHWPQDPVHRRDLYRRWIGWIAERFREAPADGATEARP